MPRGVTRGVVRNDAWGDAGHPDAGHPDAGHPDAGQDLVNLFSIFAYGRIMRSLN